MKRFKAVLVDRHIGAFVTGLLMFTAATQFLKALTAPLNTWYGNVMMSRRPPQMFENHTPVPLLDPIGFALAFLDIALYLGTALLLMKWLYLPKIDDSSDALVENETP